MRGNAHRGSDILYETIFAWLKIVINAFEARIAGQKQFKIISMETWLTVGQ